MPIIVKHAAEQMETLNLYRHPFRGILREIAGELAVTPQTVFRRKKRGDPTVLRMMTRKIEERRVAVREFEDAVMRASKQPAQAASPRNL